MTSSSELQGRFDLARQAARDAAALLRSKLGTKLAVHSKDVRNNLVTDADTQSETLIRSLVRSAFPDDEFLGEEMGLRGSDVSHRWIVDPLDGTTNYAHGYRSFCVSIAVERNGIVECGVIVDPMTGEEFCACRGSGAQRNGQPLRVSTTEDLRDALLVTGFPPHRPDAPIGNLEPFVAFIRAAQAIRRDGSAALDLCYVAAGRFDGFWEPGLHAWDIAAGALIVQEAGGMVSDYEGQALVLDRGQLVASNGRIHASMLSVLVPFTGGRP
jgi:myo-inositol-1(or 4)-monophosphatase